MAGTTVYANTRGSSATAKAATVSRKSDGHTLYCVYLDFIIYWTESDIQSYHNVLMKVTCRDEKNFLQAMLDRKRKMVTSFNLQRAEGDRAWFEQAIGTTTKPCEKPDPGSNDGKPFRSLIDACYYAYEREYDSLKLFEKVSGSKLETAIKTLMESAVEHQRLHILYLDTLLSNARKAPLPALVRHTPAPYGSN